MAPVRPIVSFKPLLNFRASLVAANSSAVIGAFPNFEDTDAIFVNVFTPTSPASPATAPTPLSKRINLANSGNPCPITLIELLKSHVL